MPAILFYAGIFLVFSIAQGVKGFISSTLSIQIREAMTKVVQKEWVYRPDLRSHNHPSQRINEDIRLCTESTLEIALEVIISGFIVLVLVMQLIGGQVLLLWSALGYTAFSLMIAWVFNKPLRNRDIDLQVAEAAHRESLHKIELGMGDYSSKYKMARVVFEYIRYAKLKLGYQMFYKVVMGFSGIVPFFILAPQYFGGTMSLGQVIEGITQFELVVVNLGILLTLYQPVIKAQASWFRVIKFYNN